MTDKSNGDIELSVVILSYNTREVTLECLEHLHKSRGVNFETIVVDNNSTDGSPEAIAKAYPKIELVASKENLGFARGNNLGMKRARGERILLLNSDCLVQPDTLAKLPDADVVGCKLLNKDGSVQPSWGFFPTLIRVKLQMLFIDNLPIVRKFIKAIHVRDVSRYEKTQEVDWVTGAFVLLKKEVFEKTGGFDPNYFMYGEEMEWMYRIKKARFKVWYSPAGIATHLQGASTKSKATMLLSEMKGLLYWYKKHNSKLEQMLLKSILMFGCMIRIPAWAVWGKWELVQAYKKVLPDLVKS